MSPGTVQVGGGGGWLEGTYHIGNVQTVHGWDSFLFQKGQVVERIIWNGQNYTQRAREMRSRLSFCSCFRDFAIPF